MEAVEGDLWRNVPTDADQKRNAYRVQRPRGRDPDGYEQERVREAQLAAPQPAVERKECRHEPDAFVTGAFLEDAYARLFETLARVQGQPAGPPGALFPVEYVDAPSPVTAFVPLAAPVRAETQTLPGGRFAVATFVGPYRAMAAGYQALGAWLGGTGLVIGGRVREDYLIGPGDGVPESEYRTEICWPVRTITTTED